MDFKKFAVVFVLLAALPGCATVIIIHRNVPPREGLLDKPTTITVPRSVRQPVIVRD
jgi:hypothetical protein